MKSEIGEIIQKVIRKDFSSITTKELQDTQHTLTLGGSYSSQILDTIKLELDRRKEIEDRKIAKQNIFWQKWGVIISWIASGIAIIISVVALYRP